MKFVGVRDPEFQALVEEAQAEALPKIMQMNCALVMNGQIQHMFAALVIELAPRMRSRAGTAQTLPPLGSGVIRLNYRLLKKHPVEIKKTFLHELAHVIATLRYKRNVGHSRLWKQIAVALGDDGGRCHTMDTSGLSYKRKPAERHVWSCSCRDFYLTKFKNRKGLEYLEKYNKSVYSCKCCRLALKPGSRQAVALIEIEEISEMMAA